MRRRPRIKRKPPLPPAPFPELRHYRTPEWRRTISQIGGTDEGYRWALQCEQEAEDARVLARRFEQTASEFEAMYGTSYNYALERADAYHRKARACEFEAELLRMTHPQQIAPRETLMDRYYPILSM
jgi:hypothetical protein